MRNISVILVLYYYIMDTLGTSDISQLYNIEKRKLIKEQMDMLDFDCRVMRQMGTITDDMIKNFRKIAENCMYKAMNDLKKKYYGEDDDNHTFIGINPPPDTVSMMDLWEKTKQLEGRYIWAKGEDMSYVVEQHTDGGVRPHVHLMIRGLLTQRPAYIAARLGDHYDISASSCEVNHFRKKRAYGEHVKYIQGIKKEEKEENTELDRQDRETLGIPHIKLFS